mgnify:CR=1 FL=1
MIKQRGSLNMERKRLLAKEETAKTLLKELDNPSRFSHASKLYKDAIAFGKKRKKRK